MISLIFSHKIKFSRSNWLVRIETSPFTVIEERDKESTFSSTVDSALQFIKFNGNPSGFYVIDCTRKCYDTQIKEILKIKHKIDVFVSPP